MVHEGLNHLKKFVSPDNAQDKEVEQLHNVLVHRLIINRPSHVVKELQLILAEGLVILQFSLGVDFCIELGASHIKIKHLICLAGGYDLWNWSFSRRGWCFRLHSFDLLRPLRLLPCVISLIHLMLILQELLVDRDQAAISLHTLQDFVS